MSLKEVADYTEEHYLNRKVKAFPTREKRQMDCIAYFEEQIKNLDISYSLQ